MTTRINAAVSGSSRRGDEAGAGRARSAAARQLRSLWPALVAALTLAGCAAAPAPEIDDDLEAFTSGIDAMLKVGMSITEARDVLSARMPPPSINTQVTAPVPSANHGQQMRRYQIGWPTLNDGTTFVLTIFCDRDGRIVRWTTGPLTAQK